MFSFHNLCRGAVIRECCISTWANTGQFWQPYIPPLLILRRTLPLSTRYCLQRVRIHCNPSRDEGSLSSAIGGEIEICNSSIWIQRFWWRLIADRLQLTTGIDWNFSHFSQWGSCPLLLQQWRAYWGRWMNCIDLGSSTLENNDYTQS